MKSFKDKLNFGRRGESVVFNRLEKQNYSIYLAPDTAHLIDAFIMDSEKKIVGCEVKTMQSFGGVTKGFQTFSFSIRHWNEYRQFCFHSGLELYINVIEHRTGVWYASKFRDLDKIATEHHRSETYEFPMTNATPNGTHTVLIPLKWFSKSIKLNDNERNQIIG